MVILNSSFWRIPPWTTHTHKPHTHPNKIQKSWHAPTFHTVLLVCYHAHSTQPKTTLIPPCSPTSALFRGPCCCCFGGFLLKKQSMLVSCVALIFLLSMYHLGVFSLLCVCCVFVHNLHSFSLLLLVCVIDVLPTSSLFDGTLSHSPLWFPIFWTLFDGTLPLTPVISHVLVTFWWDPPTHSCHLTTFWWEIPPLTPVISHLL